MIWWTDLPSRARAERQAIAELAEEADWLQSAKWRLTDDLQFVADFDIVHLGASYPLSLTYPHFFPAVPPQVTPRDGARISGHQYGAGGELCLEYRPDNWEPQFTGAMMIGSAYRLLSGESPSDGEVADVASAHRQTVAQEVRNTKLRLILNTTLLDILVEQPLLQAQPFTLDEHWFAKHWLAHPRRLGSTDAPPIWAAAPPLTEPRTREGFAIRLPDETNVSFEGSYAFLNTILTVLNFAPALERMTASDAEMPLLLVHRGTARLYSLAQGTGSRDVYVYRTIVAPANEQRLSAEHGVLADRSVAIVGCGSVGSKIAATLTRAGVGTLVLVDGDLLLPGNLVRNELDWRAVGLNKPDALAARLRDINPSTKTIVRRLLLGGQESSASTDSALQQIGQCDLIIDATADAQIFNLCGSVACAERKPLIWTEVFAGGIGGMIARSRPDLDPPPYAARRQILRWCDDNGIPWTGGDGEQYSLQIDAEKPPLIADDADVSVIAAHAGRMAIDLLKGGATTFPNSVYAIGMAREWIFAAPFDTYPIDLVPEGQWGPDADENARDELGGLLREFFPKAEEAADEG
ncbi:ThiF family adenylyltransferase [Sphingobium sp. RSMS]|uniref:ThiF family adenylyltransferase n=1 Tax=Sphingobium sp. RSMS TaxID=520734 RepID=UPI0010F6801F|nr:ThiF family adenylyltransferase [Sphingobium sp. RSMS]UXC91419.1 ThiF family adenylyltransferase [Sphingobium sp. RSMS]